MATKKTVKKTIFQPNWNIVVFGAIVFLALGLALLTAYQSGADHQRTLMQSSSVDGN